MYKELRDTLENIHRLGALQRTHLMDSPPEEAFDRLTRLAARILNAPVALVSLVDESRQFFKSCIGLVEPWATKRETPLSHSFCQYVVHSHLPLIINDAREHPFLYNNRAVAELGVVAYAGIPIRAADGDILGSFCVIDTKPRVWTNDEVEILTELTNSVMTEIDLRSTVREADARAAEAASSEARKRAILESALDCIITIDETGRILEFNPAAERTFGFQAADVLGSAMVDLIVPLDLREAHRAGLRRFLATGEARVLGKRIEITAVRADGTTFPVELAISAIQDPHPLFTAYLRDITESKQAANARRLIQETLRVERDFVAAILETVAALVLVLDRTGTIVRCNRTCEETMGYAGVEIVGKSLWDAPFYPEAEREAAIRSWSDFSDDGAPRAYESWWVTRGGERRLIAWSNTVLRDPDGCVTNVITCGIDITAQRANEVALAHARRNEVEIGAKIQQTLLVRKPLDTLCGFSIAARSQASQGIDGDYFDFFSYDGTCFDFLIGDVMGKGVPAALLGAASKSHFQRAIRRLQLVMQDFGRLPHPEEILSAVHSAMTRELVGLDSFITLCYARFDPQNRCMRMIDCGHTRTIHYHAGTASCSLLQGDNLPLGVRDEEVYVPLHVPVEPGDVLLFYSDGVTEARDESGEFFGEDRLLSAMQAGIDLNPQELVEHICACVDRFTGRASLSDDLTCVAIRFDEDAKPRPVVRAAREFAASLTDLEPMRLFLQQFCQVTMPEPLNDDITHLLILAVHEAVTNIIHHAYEDRSDQTVQIAVSYFPDRITFNLQDGGRWFDATAVPEPDFNGYQEHGFGMFIIEQCMDEVHYERNDIGRNSLTLIRRIEATDRLYQDEGGNQYEI